MLYYADKFCTSERQFLGLSDDWKDVRKFMGRIAPGATLEELQLEDYLTFLDKATQAGEVVGGAGPQDAQRPRRALLNCIGNLLDAAHDGTLTKYLDKRERDSIPAKPPMHALGAFLSTEAVHQRERWSIVSTNWDVTIDFSLKDEERNSIADYCTYTTPWERYFGVMASEAEYSVPDVPSIWRRPLQLPSVKLLKLHGSLNWLWCPTCSRLFTSSSRSIGLHGTSRSNLAPPRRRYCPECWKGGAEDKARAPLLREVLVTPTMLKRLDMVHLRMVWYNALIEMSDASQIIFVGYTAPTADFEVRYLIAKALSLRQHRPAVRVVTRPGGDTTKLERNYRSLLGNNVQVDDCGVEKLVEDIRNGRV